MRIAVLGWGSLIWNPRQLEISGSFDEGGPPLQIEFGRVSGNGRLTLVIDERNGTVCPTSHAVSAFDDLGKARENLRNREGMAHINGVGFIDLMSGDVSERAKERHPQAIPGIIEWAQRNGFDAVVWTALASNFTVVTGREFSTDEAIAYLSALPRETFAVAAEYIRLAPPQVQTPVRAAFAARWP